MCLLTLTLGVFGLNLLGWLCSVILVALRRLVVIFIVVIRLLVFVRLLFVNIGLVLCLC